MRTETQIRLRCTTDIQVKKYKATVSLGCVHTYQAVICVYLTSADHANAPVQELRKGVHTSLVVHNRHSYTLQKLRGLICFGEDKGVLLV